MHVLIPTTCDYVIVHGNKDLVDVIRLRILRWDNYPRLSKWAQHNHKGPSKREAEGSKLDQREGKCDESDNGRKGRKVCLSQSHEPRCEVSL